MKLSLDPESTVKQKRCSNCHSAYTDIRELIYRDDSAYAAALIECHRHDDKPEIFFSVIFGTWGDNDDYTKNLTITCRYGDVISGEEMACTLLDAPEKYTEPMFGKTLSRTEALASDRLDEFWKVVDYLLEADTEIHNFLHHQ